jgi:hypothetical protein
MLQLCNGTMMVLDECVMAPGQLNAAGVRNITALGNLLSSQVCPMHVPVQSSSPPTPHLTPPNNHHLIHFTPAHAHLCAQRLLTAHWRHSALAQPETHPRACALSCANAHRTPHTHAHRTRTRTHTHTHAEKCVHVRCPPSPTSSACSSAIFSVAVQPPVLLSTSLCPHLLLLVPTWVFCIQLLLLD